MPVDDATDLATIPSQEKAVLVVGNEAHGVRPKLMNRKGNKGTHFIPER
ncbi:MAG: hypothetical protein U5J63_16165 [Fodinibius sp.]|nr:hypothetical protein [Fodinibius sp.]